jgi:osmoprotectant transport system substrate-binding protein
MILQLGFKRMLAVTGVAVVALSLAACGSSGDPLAGGSAAPSGSSAGGPIIVGSANFTESNVIGELYAQAMKAKGVQTSTKPNIGSREVYIKALKDKSISVVPEYTGNLLGYFDKTSTATSASDIEAALPKAVGADLKVLKVSAAADQDVYVVTKQYAADNQIASLEDLKKVASTATLGGPSELSQRPYGPIGLKKVYGVTFKAVKGYDSPAVKVKDLNANKFQVGEFFTTDSPIAENGYVELKDPKNLIKPQNVVPLVRAEVASNTAATGAIEAVQAALTTADLTALNKKVDVDHEDPNQVAAEWLKSKGLA